jgi:hypothetical protein
MIRWAWILGTCCALVGASAASAASPVVLGQGGNAGGAPDIAVDASGRAHVAWYNYPASPYATIYCQLPRGGTGCASAKSFGPGSGETSFQGRPHVFLPSANRVVLLETRDFVYNVRQSSNNGASFGARVEIGDMSTPGSHAPDESVFGPDESITSYGEVGGDVPVQNASLAGPVQTAYANLQSATGDQGAIGLHGSVPVAVLTDFSGSSDYELRWRKYDGTGTINSASNWTAAQIIEDNQDSPPDYVSLASGPNGLFLLYSLERSTGDVFVVRKFTGTSFGPAIKVSEEVSLNAGDLTQDAGGVLHAVYHQTNGRRALRWTASSDGVSWSAPVTIHEEDPHTDVRVAAAPDHRGFAVFDGSQGVTAVPLEALSGAGPGINLPPSLTNLRADPRTFKVGKSPTPTSAKTATGTKLRFNLSEAAQVSLVFRQIRAGIRPKRPKGKKPAGCGLNTLARRLALRKKYGKKVKFQKCRVLTTRGVLRRSSKAGANSVAFSGRVGTKPLPKGKYLLLGTAVDATKLVGRDRAGFKVVKPKKKKKK